MKPKMEDLITALRTKLDNYNNSKKEHERKSLYLILQNYLAQVLIFEHGFIYDLNRRSFMFKLNDSINSDNLTLDETTIISAINDIKEDIELGTYTSSIILFQGISFFETVAHLKSILSLDLIINKQLISQAEVLLENSRNYFYESYICYLNHNFHDLNSAIRYLDGAKKAIKKKPDMLYFYQGLNIKKEKGKFVRD